MEVREVTIRDVLNVFWGRAKRYPFLFAGMITVLCSALILSAIYPIYYKKFFDIIAVAMPTEATRDTLLGIVFFILCLHLVEFVFYRAASVLDNIFTARMMADLRNYAFEKVMDQSYGFFTNMFTGAIVQRVNRLATAFQKFNDRAYWHLLAVSIRLTATLVILAFYSQPFALVFACFGVILVTVNIIFARWKIRYDVRRARDETHTTAVLADAITNNDTIRLFHRFGHERQRFGYAVEKLRHSSVVAWLLSTVNESAQGLLFISTIFGIFYVGTHLWYAGEISLGTLILGQTYYLLLQRQLWELPRTIRDLFESVADSEEMIEIIHLQPSILDAPDAKELIVTKGEVVIRDMNFSYEETTPVFQDLSLRIKGGERIAFVGQSGAGKSSLVRLLLRLHDIDSGSITVDGQDIGTVTQGSLRKAIAFVPQEPILFHRSLLENIRYGRPDATEEEVHEASRLAHCEEFIKKLGVGYSTLVGERGVKLSGGEKQRIAIARVILKNAPILVLDEATSSLDSESEKYIQDALEHLMKGKTTIAIAHRLSTIRKMDRIVVLDGGHIVEEGSHEKLLEKESSLYAKLWALQSGGFLRDEDI